MRNTELELEHRAHSEAQLKAENEKRAEREAAAACEAQTIEEMLREMTRPKSGEMPRELKEVLYAAYGHTLFLWWHSALSHTLTAETKAEKVLAGAVANRIAAECVRRCGPKGSR